MIRRSLLGVVFLLAATSAAHAQSPVALTECGTITQPGNYVFANDLTVLGDVNPISGDCLIVSSPRVHIDMQGLSVAVICPTFPLFCAAVRGMGEYLGDIGIHIMPGADHVSISNGSVNGFNEGIIVEANYASANDLQTDAALGATLINASHANFANIGALVDQGHPGGYLASITGGSHNTFTGVHNNQGFSRNLDGLVFTNSSFNIVNGAQINSFAFGPEEEAAGILLRSGSNHNSITNSSISATLTNGMKIDGSEYNIVEENNVQFDNQTGSAGILLVQDSNHNSIENNGVYGDFYGNGIEIDLGSGSNVVEGNDVSAIPPHPLPPLPFDLLDENPQCDHNVWSANTFTTASPASCIN